MKKITKLKLKDATVLNEPQMKVVTGGSGVTGGGNGVDTCPQDSNGNIDACRRDCHPGGILTESGICYMAWGASTCFCKNYRDF